MNFKNIHKNFYFVTIFLATFILLLTLISGEVNDYRLYLKNWNISNAGESPWTTKLNGVSIRNSSYGPLHTVIGYLILLNTMIPKFLFASSGFITFLILIKARNSYVKKIDNKDLYILLLIYPLFPLTIITTYIYGINDALIALFVVIACEARRRKDMIATGIILGLGALLKFYPILFLIFFSLCPKRGISFKCLLSGLLVFILGIFFSYLIWGSEVFKPFLFGSDRAPKLLSILKFFDYLKDSYNLYLFENLINFLITKNSFLILIVVFCTFLHGYMAEIEWEYVSVVGILLIFMTYKVGHPQFYLTWTAFLAWMIASSEPASNKNLFAWRLFPIAIFLGFYQSIYFLSGLMDNGHLRNDWQIIRDLGSIPLLLIVILCLFLNKEFFIRSWTKKKLSIW